MGAGIINEYDKLADRGAKHPLDEIFRKVLDDGSVPDGQGGFIDVSQFTFILTTNETTKSLIPNAPEDPDDDPNVDPTRTVVHHDGSFLTRLRVVPFHQLSVEAYKEIAQQQFMQSFKFFQSAKGGKLKFEISNDFYDKIASYTKSKFQGARPIGRLVEDLIGQVVTLTVNTVEGQKKTPGLKFKVDFNEKTGKFDVKIISKYTPVKDDKKIASDTVSRYKEMAESEIEGCFKYFTSMKDNKLKFKYDKKELYDKVGSYVDAKGYTSEFMTDLANDLLKQISDNILKTEECKKEHPDLEFSINFDEKTGKFDVKIISDYTPLQELPAPAPAAQDESTKK